ncbi:MAG: hypothetical protein ACM3JB_13805 [Acidobacteriaceae bacterium]
MCQQREPRFEALVFTENPSLGARCARSFAEFPVDWVMFYESSLALEYLAKERFDYVILDLDSAENASVLLDAVTSGINLRSVVLAVTSSRVNPAILDFCYASRVFYPVRPVEIEEQLYRTIPLAERLASERLEAVTESAAEGEPVVENSVMREFSWLSKLLAKTAAVSFRNIFRMKHSLGVVAQERAASLLASFGTMWFVQEITRDFRGIEFIDPPSAGPSYLMALALLLWLCAKHRRVAERVEAVGTER